MKGFSRSNIFYIRKFYYFYSDAVHQLVGLNRRSENKTSVGQAAALKTELPKGELAQQLATLNSENSIQQPVGLNQQIFNVHW